MVIEVLMVRVGTLGLGPHHFAVRLRRSDRRIRSDGAWCMFSSQIRPL